MDGYCQRFLNSSIIQSLLLQEGREKMGNSITRRKEKKKNERFDEILADSVEDVVLMRRSEDWACCSKKEITSSDEGWKQEIGCTRMTYVQNGKYDSFIGSETNCEIFMMGPDKEPVANFEQIHRIRVTALTANDKILFSGGRDCVVGVYDRETRKCISRCKIPRNLVTDACFCGENTVAQVGEDLSMKIWDTRDMQKKPSMLFRGFKYFALGVCTLVENQTVVTSSTGHTVGGCEIRIWDIRKGGVMSKLSSHKEAATCVSRVSQSRFLSGSADGTVFLWDINQSLGPKCIIGIEDLGSPVTSLDCFGGRCAVGTEDGSMYLLRYVGKHSLADSYG